MNAFPQTIHFIGSNMPRRIELSVRNLVVDGNRANQAFECWGGPCDPAVNDNPYWQQRVNGITVNGCDDWDSSLHNDAHVEYHDVFIKGLRPETAEPPAESPSTMKSSLFAGSRSWQSASLPGRPTPSSTPFLRVMSRAFRAASRARAASTILPQMILASGPLSSSIQRTATGRAVTQQPGNVGSSRSTRASRPGGPCSTTSARRGSGGCRRSPGPARQGFALKS